MVVPRQTKSGAFLARQFARYAADSAYKLSRMKKLPGLANGLTSALKRNAYIQGKVAKPVETFLKSASKRGGDVAKAAEAGGIIAQSGQALKQYAPILAALSAVGIAIAVNIIQGWRNDQNEKGQESLSRDLSRVLGKLNQYQQQIKNNQTAIKEFKQQDQRTRDRIYAVEKQQPKIREDANNALYETRQGRKIVEDKIAKNTNELNTLKSQFEKIVRNTNDNFQKNIETTVNNIQKALQQANTQVERANSELSKLNTKINAQEKLLTEASKAVRAVQKLPAATANAITQIQRTTVRAIRENGTALQRAVKPWGVTVTPATVTEATVTSSDNTGLTITPATVTPATVTYSNFSTSDAALQLKVNQERETDSLKRQISALGGGVTVAAAEANQARLTALQALAESKKKGITDLSPVYREIEKVKAEIQSETDRKINRQLKEIGTVDAQANKKLDDVRSRLDQMIPMLGLIPARAGQDAANRITPNIPTSDKIENAVGNAICKSLNSGCGKASLDDAVGRVNQHNTNNTGSILDAVNTGANAALLQGQQTILQRLGDQLPGGIGGKLTRFTNWLKLDRVLNILIFASTVHNAFQLTSDIGQSLGTMLGNVFQVIGIKDDDGGAIDVGQIINSSVENILKGIIGAENYKQMSQAWAKANRIYQATANVVNSFTNVGHTILNGLEVVGGQNGKIGNALRVWGVVGEKAYEWMNPQPNYHSRVLNFLEKVQETASTVEQVTQVPLDVINAVTELNQSTKELVNSVEQKPNTPQGQNVGDAEAVKQKQEEAKAASSGALIDLTDIFNANN